MSSKNVLVYAFHTEDPEIEKYLQIQELRYSLDTLRKHNTDIDVKIYISPIGAKDRIERYINLHNAEILDFQIDPDPRFTYKPIYSKWVDSKWKAAFHTFEKYDYENLLMIDCDTVFFNNPEIIFEKYNDASKVYSKQDRWQELFEPFEIKGIPMNDSVVLLNRSWLGYKHTFLREKDNFALNVIKKLWDKFDKDSGEWKYGLHLASHQYGIGEYLKSFNNSLVFFDPIDVAHAEEFEELTSKKDACILHYSNMYVQKYLPKEYWYDKDNYFSKMVEEVNK